MPPEQPTPSKRLILVTGAGRSGTSTVAGTLHYLGMHVPLPVIKPNESNPMGFFESTWPLWFHRRLMDKAFIQQTDGRPEAAELMAKAVTPEIREELRGWLGEVAAQADQVVVKDPRSIWVPWLWEETAASLGMTTGYLTMVRHPAEVLGSRATYYGGRTTMEPWRYAVMNLCGWANGNLVVERQTRGRPRVVLRYYDLIEDWRAGMARVRDTFDVTFQDDLDPGHRHPVDDFIDPSLRRHDPSWEEFDLPPELVEIAEGVFGCMGRLADTQGSEEAVSAEMDRLGEQYAAVMRKAQAISRDTTASAATAARVHAEQEVRAELEEKLQRARANARRARERAEAAEAALTPRGLARKAYTSVRRRVRRRRRRGPA